MADIRVGGTANHRTITIPIVGFKNDMRGDGKSVTLHQSSNARCCPVHTFEEWKRRTTSLRRGRRDCPLLFSLTRPVRDLSPRKSTKLLKEAASLAGLDNSIFTAKTFRKSGVMAGLAAGVEPDAIFRLGGWHSAETFWSHYVVRQVPRTYTDLLFGTTVNDESSL
jgi:hypothetical protein